VAVTGGEPAPRVVELAERLGLDCAWVTHDHADPLAEAARRTERITLGGAGFTPTEELTGARFHFAVDAEATDSLERLRALGPAAARRIWCAAGSARSARWAGEQGLNLLADRASATRQPALIRTFRENHPAGAWARICLRLVALPTDSATPAQRARYQEYAPELAAPAAELAARLRADLAFREVEEAAFVLPDGLAPEDQEQLLTDLAERLGPALGWQPVH
jgi:alkanesulfonate monooxygenase SsuD/methylene tetrahydromethanopterin reductase-like flavin-dependent oxidoreductase (luciferase family)